MHSYTFIMHGLPMFVALIFAVYFREEKSVTTKNSFMALLG